jgi:hypothetical protein
MDDDLRALLSRRDPKARDDLRRALIGDQADRDAISSRLMRYRDLNGKDWAEDHRLPDDVSVGATAGGQAIGARSEQHKLHRSNAG